MRSAIDTYGDVMQITVAFEEMSELQKELCKYIRGIGSKDNICMIDCDECNNLFDLETRGDWDGVKAWADMPKYKGGDGDA